jgi:hypothetical protein
MLWPNRSKKTIQIPRTLFTILARSLPLSAITLANSAEIDRICYSEIVRAMQGIPTAGTILETFEFPKDPIVYCESDYYGLILAFRPPTFQSL